MVLNCRRSFRMKLACLTNSHSVSSSGFIQTYLWSNAGFNKLRDRPELDDVEPRFEPVVIKTSHEATASGSSVCKELLGEDWNLRTEPGVYPSILDYHEAYKFGKLTPSTVAEALLPFIRRNIRNASKHSTAFLESKIDLILKAAEESTKRYRNSTYLSPLDGVPVVVKDQEDVSGYSKCLGSKLDYTRKDNATSFNIQQWLDAGAVLVGKTNMHELGMDTTVRAQHSLPLQLVDGLADLVRLACDRTTTPTTAPP